MCLGKGGHRRKRGGSACAAGLASQRWGVGSVVGTSAFECAGYAHSLQARRRATIKPMV